MKRVLYISDKHTNMVKQQLQFLHQYQPKKTLFGWHVRQVSQEPIEPGTLVHINQPPLTVAKDATSDDILDILAKPPYNVHDSWLRSFDHVYVTYYDVSKNDRFIHTVK